MTSYAVYNHHKHAGKGSRAERVAALRLLDRAVVRRPGMRRTLGADTQYQAAEFIEGLRQRAVAPHVSEYVQGRERVHLPRSAS